MRQFRLVHVGVAAALVAATIAAAGLVQAAGSAGGTPSVFVPIVPCRLADTRPGGENVGTRATPLGAGEAATFVVSGTNGNCIIPNTATGIATNTTAVNPTAGSYLTLYPADAIPRPTTSNLNFIAGSAPTPNQVTVGLSAAGAIAAYNNAGTVDIIIDIVGYYQTAATATGPQGLQGPQGIQGVPGPACPTGGCTVYFGAFGAVGNEAAPVTSHASGCVSSAGMFLGLPLPFGAVLTTVTVRYIDTAPGASFELSLQKVSSPTTKTVASPYVYSINMPNPVGLPLTSAATPVGADADYYVQISSSTAQVETGLQLCGATVTYHF